MINFSDIINRVEDRIPVIVGPTASGKTSLSIILAEKLNGEVISVDSRQIYKNFRIGTAQPSSEEIGGVPHYLIDILDANKVITAGDYVELVEKYMKKVIVRHKRPILVGGSLLYIRSICEGIIEQVDSNLEVRKKIQNRINKEGVETLLYEMSEIDSEYSKIIHFKDTKRLIRAFEIYELTGKPPSVVFEEQRNSDSNRRKEYFIINIKCNRDKLYEQIELRVDKMIANGWLEEVKSILNSGVSIDNHAMQSVGYRQMSQVIDGKLTLEEARVIIKQKTRQFAKRQLTWLRKMHIDYQVNMMELI